MLLEDQAVLSCYEQLTPLDTEKRVWLVRDIRDSGIYVRKQFVCDSPDIYKTLQAASIEGVPEIIHIFVENNKVTTIEAYVHGETAEKHFASKEYRTESSIIKFGIDICNILTRLHSLEPPIICRDIKPSNLMIDSGEWFIIDFNIARNYEPDRKEDTHLLGTASYAPPEQYGFGQTDVRSDIYSLAVTMCVLLTGSFPKDALLEGEFGEVIKHATKLDPEDRYQSAELFAEALQAIATKTKSTNPPISDSEITDNHNSSKTAQTTHKSLPTGLERLKRPSTIIAIIGYTFWLIIILKFTGKVEFDGQPATQYQTCMTYLAFFLLLFVPYFYNANYFHLLDRTLKRFSCKHMVYWLMRILFTILITIGIVLFIALII